MNLHISKMLLMATAMAWGTLAWADSGAADRSKAFGYAFTQEELDSFPQKTNLPTVYLQVYKTAYDEATGTTSFQLTDGKASLESQEVIHGTKNSWYFKTKIVIRDDNGTIKERNEWLGIRGRGNATWDMGNYSIEQKKPFRLKFPSKTDLLTTMENGTEVNHHARAKSWTLLANSYDATLMHNAMAYEIGTLLQLPFCPAYKFVDVVINGVYKGTYQISDQVQVGTGRVDIDETTGYFLEACDSRFKEDPWLNNITGFGIVNVKSPDPDVVGNDNTETTDPKYADLKSHLNKVGNLVQNGPYDQPDNWRDYIDVTSAAKVFIGQDLLANYDGGQGNNYAYMNDLTSKIFLGPLWDFDLAMNTICNGKNLSEGHFWNGSGNGVATLCKNLFENDAYFVKALYEEWEKIYDNGNLTNTLLAKVDEMYNNIQASATLNYTSRENGGAGQNLSKGWADGNYYSDYAAAKESLKSFVTTHVAYLQTEYKNKYDKLNCANLPEISSGDDDNPAGLVDTGTEKWTGGHLYKYYGSKKTMVEGATITIQMKGTTAEVRYTAFTANENAAWKQSYGGAGETQTIVLTTEDVAKLAANRYMFSLVVDKGTCESITISGGNVPEACTTHDYADCAYDKQADGTYRRVCNVCKEVETDGEVYYLFTVYPESATTTEVYATEWQPDSEHPNAIAVVKVNAGMEANIKGYNIVNSTKNSLGDQVCPDLRITDGHPYYSDKKFNATKASYTRTVANTWGTIILPYKYQKATTETASFYHLQGVETDNEGKTIFVLTAIDPGVDGNASAYTPVFFRRSSDDVTSITVEGENITVKKSTADKANTTAEGWTLNGVMEPTTLDGTSQSLYYVSKDKFWHATGSLTVNPFRAYVEKTATTPDAASIGIFVAGEEDASIVKALNSGQATTFCTERGALCVTASEAIDLAVFTAGGAQVCHTYIKAGETRRIALPAGIYVVNGIKVVIK